MMRSLMLVMVCAASVLACGNAHAEGNKKSGENLVYTCHGCHGVPGYQNAYPSYHVPRIAGQNEKYIIDALHAYKRGDRKHPTMDAQAESLSDQDIEDIAAYLSSLSPSK